MKEQKTQCLFLDYNFLSNEYDENNFNSIYKLTSNTNKTPSSLKNLKGTGFKERELLKKELNVGLSSNKNTHQLPNINKFKSGSTSELSASTQRSDIDNKKKLKRNISQVSTNPTSSNFTLNFNQLNQKNPNLIKIKSFSSLEKLMTRKPATDLASNKLSYSSKNVKFNEPK